MGGAGQSIVLMGVSGCGKSLIGHALARELALPFVEGDEYHGDENKNKMRNGIPLNDEDRLSWLTKLAALLASAESPVILGCSALKRSYREILGSGQGDLLFIHLHGSREVVERRIKARKGHFFNPQLLSSQIEILEALQEDEHGFRVNVADSEHLVLAEIISRLDDWGT